MCLLHSSLTITISLLSQDQTQKTTKSKIVSTKGDTAINTIPSEDWRNRRIKQHRLLVSFFSSKVIESIYIFYIPPFVKHFNNTTRPIITINKNDRNNIMSKITSAIHIRFQIFSLPSSTSRTHNTYTLIIHFIPDPELNDIIPSIRIK